MQRIGKAGKNVTAEKKLVRRRRAAAVEEKRNKLALENKQNVETE
jgi:hypothetical protein